MPTISNDPCNCASGSASAWSGATYNIYATATETTTTTETSTVDQTVYVRNIDATSVNATLVSCTELTVDGEPISGYQNISSTPGNTVITGDLEITGDTTVDGMLIGPIIENPTITGSNGVATFQDVTTTTLTTGDLTFPSMPYIRYPLMNGYIRNPILTQTANFPVVPEIPIYVTRVTICWYNIGTANSVPTGQLLFQFRNRNSTYKSNNYRHVNQGVAGIVTPVISATNTVSTYWHTGGVPIGISAAAATGNNMYRYTGKMVLDKVWNPSSGSVSNWIVTLNGNRIVSNVASNISSYFGSSILGASSSSIGTMDIDAVRIINSDVNGNVLSTDGMDASGIFTYSME